MLHECPICGYAFDPNAPGVDRTEAPYFTHVSSDGARTRYICSSVCMSRYLKGCKATEPGEPSEVSY